MSATACPITLPAAGQNEASPLTGAAWAGPPEDRAALLALDDPLEWPSFGHLVSPSGSVWESHVAVQGMHCAACAMTLETRLRQVPGVCTVRVSAAAQRATVVWDSAQVQVSQWMSSVQALGYRLVPAQDSAATALRRRESRAMLWRCLVAGLCMMQVMMYAYPAYTAAPGDLSLDMQQLLRWASWVLSLPVLLFSCGPFFSSAWRDLKAGRIGMDLPVALGIAVTFAVSTVGTFEPDGAFGREVYFDSLTMFVFFLLSGRWLELRLRDRSAGALDAVFNRLPDSVECLNSDGVYARISAQRVRVGDTLRIHAGDTFPADALILEGESAVDEAMLTGESLPLPRASGDRVLAGSHNLAGTLCVRVERIGSDTRFAQIAALMESAATEQPQLARLADRLAKPFLIGVVFAAGAAVLWWWPRDPAHALMVAVAVLVVTCPCALSLATPAALLAAAGRLARQGVLVRRLQALETLAQVDTVVFDKTGTLSTDSQCLEQVQTRDGVTVEQALAWAGAMAASSRHPAAIALRTAAQDAAVDLVHTGWTLHAVKEFAGRGVEAQLRDSLDPAEANTLQGAGRAGSVRHLRLGSAAFCGVSEKSTEGSHVILADEAGWVATFGLREQLRKDALPLVQTLKAMGIEVHILSGDTAAAVGKVAAQLDIGQSRARCTPDDKLAALRTLQQQGHTVAMVGDGLNDAPVLAGAHVAFALAHAAPLAQSRADCVLMGSQLEAIGHTLLLARQAMRVVRQNLAWALVYNVACVPLAFAGLLPAWLAGLGMAASSLLVVANSARLAHWDQGPARLEKDPPRPITAKPASGAQAAIFSATLAERQAG